MPEGGPGPGPDGPGTGRVVVARATDEHAELALARRGDVVELVVDGVFAMDTVDTGTERALAQRALDLLAATRGPAAPARVLVGGLGLGFTVATLLADDRVGRVHVVELHAALVGWARQGLLPLSASALGDPRVTVTVADVLDVVPGLPAASLDAVLLDVDNGPGFLIHQRNAAVYRSTFLAAAARTLTPGGVLAVWSADRSEPLADALRGLDGLSSVVEVPLEARRDGRTFAYALYLAARGGLP